MVIPDNETHASVGARKERRRWVGNNGSLIDAFVGQHDSRSGHRNPPGPAERGDSRAYWRTDGSPGSMAIGLPCEV